MRLKLAKILIAAGLMSCLLTGCGNVIPELTESEASMIATYAADLMLGSGKEKMTRLVDTEAETKRLADLAEKVSQLQKRKATQEEAAQEGANGDSQKADAQTGDSQGGNGAFAGTAGVAQSAVKIEDFVGLNGFEVSYAGYEIKKSYSADEGDVWEPAFDASTGKNLLVVKLDVKNVSDAPAVADVMSKDMLFSLSGDNGISSMAQVTMLLNDFANAKDEIAAGETKQYVLVAEISEQITEAGALTLQMKKGTERANAPLQ